jgi:hypothetical protein
MRYVTHAGWGVAIKDRDVIANRTENHPSRHVTQKTLNIISKRVFAMAPKNKKPRQNLSTKRKEIGDVEPLPESKRVKSDSPPETPIAPKSPGKQVMNLHGIPPVLPDAVHLNENIIAPFSDVNVYPSTARC